MANVPTVKNIWLQSEAAYFRSKLEIGPHATADVPTAPRIRGHRASEERGLMNMCRCM